MADAPYRPYTLWFVSLLNGNALRLIVCPGPQKTGLVVHRNNHFERLLGTWETVGEAEAAGRSLHGVLRG